MNYISKNNIFKSPLINRFPKLDLFRLSFPFSFSSFIDKLLNYGYG